MFDAPARHAPRETSWRIEIEAAADASAVEALVLAVFGPGRFAKTAERLRVRVRGAVGLVGRGDGRRMWSGRRWRWSLLHINQSHK